MLVWGNCSDALFTQLKNQYIRTARIIYKVPEKVCSHNILGTVKWQNLGYTYKRRLASVLFKIVKDPVVTIDFQATLQYRKQKEKGNNWLSKE